MRKHSLKRVASHPPPLPPPITSQFSHFPQSKAYRVLGRSENPLPSALLTLGEYWSLAPAGWVAVGHSAKEKDDSWPACQHTVTHRHPVFPSLPSVLPHCKNNKHQGFLRRGHASFFMMPVLPRKHARPTICQGLQHTLSKLQLTQVADRLSSNPLH